MYKCINTDPNAIILTGTMTQIPFMGRRKKCIIAGITVVLAFGWFD